MFDIISDCHGCVIELRSLLEKLGYVPDGLSFKPPEGRMAVFVGDIVSRGPNSLAVLFLVRDMIEKKYALVVQGNHDNKIMRFCQGRDVILLHGDDGAAREIENSKTITKKEIADFFASLPFFLSLDGGKLIVSHAAYKPLQGVSGNFDKKYRTWSLFGPTTGLTLPNGLPDRIDWAAQRVADESSPTIVCGHQPFHEVRIINKVYQIDTGCVFGGKLTVLKYPEMEIVQVPAQKQYAINVGWEE